MKVPSCLFDRKTKPTDRKNVALRIGKAGIREARSVGVGGGGRRRGAAAAAVTPERPASGGGVTSAATDACAV